MSDFIIECKNTVSKVQDLLKENQKWISTYDEYAVKILANLEKIRNNKQKFHEWAPLFLYMNVSEAKGKLTFSLRFLGQDVAKLKVGKEKITLSTKGFEISNSSYFGCLIQLTDCEWKSDEVVKFRRHFINPLDKDKHTGKLNNEHRIESLLLSEFSKKSRVDKWFNNIQPVKFAGIARFQMPTPLSASNMKKLKYSGPSGGGIDILTRIGTGKATKLCIMELKDKNGSGEPPVKTIQQGLAYATFIRELLRSKSGEAWWKLFGFNGKLPAQLKLYVACVMPSLDINDVSFAGDKIEIENDTIQLHFVYFEETDNKITEINTSLN